VNRPVPATGLDGKFSVQYATLVALLDGEITIDSFTNERRFAPDVEALLPQVMLTVDDAIPSDFDQMHTIVNVWLKDGQKLSKRVDKLSGWIGSPLTREQRLKKFFGCTRRTLDETKARRMLALVEELDTLADVTEIMTIARCDR
jgi:aconitate decarboxylase